MVISPLKIFSLLAFKCTMSQEQGSPTPLVHLLDDDPSYRDSLVSLITTFGFEPRPYTSGQDFLTRICDTEPGPLILDLKLPELSGHEVLAILVKRQPRRPVIVLTGYADIPGVVRCYATGRVSSFLQKQTVTELALLEAIQCATLEDTQRRTAHARKLHFDSLLQQLTPAEHELLQRLLQGQTNATIAAAFEVSRRTIECRRAKLLKTFGVTNVCDLVRLVVPSSFPSP